MKPAETGTTLAQRPWVRMAGLAELLLCVMYAAVERLESLRPEGKTA